MNTSNSDLPDTTEQERPPATLEERAQRAASRAQQGGLKDSTRNLYEKKWARFEDWMQREFSAVQMPPDPEVIVTFLDDFREERGLTAPTLEGYVSAIRHRCRQAGEEPTTSHELVKQYLEWARSEEDSRKRKKAKPLYVEDLKRLLETCDRDTVQGLRDYALLLVGYVGALRRSEIAQMDASHLEERDGGYLLWIPRQKNDPEGDGQWKGIPETGRSTSPASALSDWLGETGIEEGAIFRSVDRWGNVGDRIGLSSINYLFKKRLEEAGLDPEAYSTHSLRAGFVTQATEAGVEASQIQQQTGHESIESLTQYVRSGDALQNPAVQEIGL